MTSEQIHLGGGPLEKEFRSRVSAVLGGWRGAPPAGRLSRAERWRFRVLYRQFREQPVRLVRWSMGMARWLAQKVRR